MVVSAFLIKALLGAAFAVHGTATCPQPDDVAAALSKLDANLADWKEAWLENDPDGLRLELRSATGRVLSRRLPFTESCESLAETAAVVLWTWALSPPRSSLTLPDVRVPRVIAQHKDKPIFDWSVGVLALGLVDSMQLSPSLGLDADVIHRAGIGVSAALALELERGLAFGSGQVHWQRSRIELGPLYRFSQGVLELDARVRAAVGLLGVRGSGFEQNDHLRGTDWAVEAGVKVMWRRGPLSPFFLLNGSRWLSQQTITVDNVQGQVALPRWELSVGLGIAFASAKANRN